ncbi:hypothetical protein [Lysobacter gummosus]
MGSWSRCEPTVTGCNGRGFSPDAFRSNRQTFPQSGHLIEKHRG